VTDASAALAAVNLLAGWTSVLLGFAAGAVPGLYFWREEWLGGYGSWRRRMVRLAHISFFGLGFINIFFALTVWQLGLSGGTGPLHWASWLLVAGNCAMPAVCYLAAWRLPFRQLFFIPVICEVLGVGILVRELARR
jgi:hypothetical protein